MLKPLIVALPLFLVGCSSARKDPYQPVALCKKINLSPDSSPAEEYTVPSISSNNKEIIHIPLPPDLSR